jgi:hypothetical protein
MVFGSTFSIPLRLIWPVVTIYLGWELYATAAKPMYGRCGASLDGRRGRRDRRSETYWEARRDPRCSMMGTIAIAVDGEQVFNWQGDEAEAKHILEQFPRGAHHVGMTPEELSDEGIGQLLKDGRFLSESRVVREMQMMGVIWRILEMEINDPSALARSLITSATRTSTSTFKCMVRGLWQPWPPSANSIRENESDPAGRPSRRGH